MFFLMAGILAQYHQVPFPSHFNSETVDVKELSSLQWRDRAGFSPASLFNF
jgi:hypothetical protein